VSAIEVRPYRSTPNLQVRATNRGVVEFYESLGYDVESHVSLGKVLGQEGA
jgi:ribosomal protein S18 acetylase RimI-like enzyme